MKKLSSILIIAFIISGLFFSKTPSLEAYSSSTCVTLSQNIPYGSTDNSTGGSVSQLQLFLVNQGLLNTYSFTAGVYDSGTASAVSVYQGSHGLPTTGVVDAATRASILAFGCNGTTTTTYTNGYYQNGCLSGALYNTITGQLCSSSNGYYNNGYQNIPGCYSGYVYSTITGQLCSGNGYQYPTYPTYPTNYTSTMNISGPTRLAIGATGTWTLSMSNQNSSYATVSVNYGDTNYYNGYNNGSYYNSPSQASLQSNQSTTFTHTYQNSGTYTVTFTTSDGSGLQSTSSMTVRVGY